MNNKQHYNALTKHSAVTEKIAAFIINANINKTAAPGLSNIVSAAYKRFGKSGLALTNNRYDKATRTLYDRTMKQLNSVGNMAKARYAGTEGSQLLNQFDLFKRNLADKNFWG